MSAALRFESPFVKRVYSDANERGTTTTPDTDLAEHLLVVHDLALGLPALHQPLLLLLLPAVREHVRVHLLRAQVLHLVGLLVEDGVGALDRRDAHLLLQLRLEAVDLLALFFVLVRRGGGWPGRGATVVARRTGDAERGGQRESAPTGEKKEGRRGVSISHAHTLANHRESIPA